MMRRLRTILTVLRAASASSINDRAKIYLISYKMLTDFSQSSFLLFSGTVTRHVLVAVSISGGFGMDALLIKTGGLLLIVALGYLLKRRGVFQQGDARLLSRIIVNLTLPGALLSSFSAFRLVPSLLAVLAAAAAANVLLLAVSALVTRRRPGPVRALYLLNAPSYNIGTFVLPFVQSFLPPDMLLAVSMFDAGNSPFNCGGAYALTAALTGGERLTVRSVLGRMLRSVPFDTFLVILLLGLLGLRLPQPVYTVAGMFGQANAFLAMLMIGLLLEPRIPQESRSDVLRVVLLRYGFGLAASAVCWMLPLPAGIRQVLALSLLAPVPSVSLAYCERCGCDSGAVGAIHSLCIPISLAFTLLVCLM